jgi:hypothetical protein
MLFKLMTGVAYDDPRSTEIVRPLVLLEREKFTRGFFCEARGCRVQHCRISDRLKFRHAGRLGKGYLLHFPAID